MATLKYISPSAKQQFFDLNGDPAVSYKLYTYVTGSSTPANTYTDATGDSANTNPIVLDSRGEADVWLTPGTVYRFILKTSADVQVWSVDGIESGSFEDLTIRDDLTVGGDITGGWYQWLCWKAVSESQVITTGEGKATQTAMPACEVLAVRAGLVTASSSGTVTFDINKNGTSILGTKLTIDEDETSSVTAASQATIVTETIENDSTLRFDIDGAGTDAAGWMVYMKVRWT